MKLWFSLSIVFFSLPTAAQEEAPASQEAPKVEYKAHTEVDFQKGDEVEGTTQRPEVDVVESHKRKANSSLIKVRQNFLPEMIKTAEGD